MSAKLLKGRYTATDSRNNFLGAVRYLNPNTGELYEDSNGERYANSGFRAAGNGRWVYGTWEFVTDTILPQRIKGRYTKSLYGAMNGIVRYLDPVSGCIFKDATGGSLRCGGFKPGSRTGVWTDGEDFEFTADEVADEVAVESAILGYVISSANGAPTVLHRTQEIAEAEALRLAKGNTGVEFTVFPVYCGKAVAKAHTPKPVAKLEKL